MQASIRVLLAPHRESVSGYYSYLVGKGGTIYASMSIWVSWVLRKRNEYFESIICGIRRISSNLAKMISSVLTNAFP